MNTHTTPRRYAFTFDECPARHDYADTVKPCTFCGTPLNAEAEPETVAVHPATRAAVRREEGSR